MAEKRPGDGLEPHLLDPGAHPRPDLIEIGDLARHARTATVGATGHWVLQSQLGDDEVQRTPVRPLPFTIGRMPGLTLTLPSAHVSKRHAEIYSDGVALRLRDLGSRNGTFLNRLPISDSALHEGDQIGIGNYEFVIVPEDSEAAAADETIPLARHLAAAKVRDLINHEAVFVSFQPIVAIDTGVAIAYEALGGGRYPGLPQNPVDLFDVAGGLGASAQAELSRLMRRKAVETVRDRPQPPLLFLNTHPADLEQVAGLLRSLGELRAEAPRVPLVLEVHESALADPELIAYLRSRLAGLQIGLAYDDFGAGQARLLELAEAPPDYLKFDRRFVTRIESAPESRRRVLAALVAAARELKVTTVAEGVETAEEAAECRRAGFSHAQGFYYGRPGPFPGAATAQW
ncbi:MAG TPA: EAL domain-containing protein [Vicinamibacteria bacterium]|nr:EAL domain-containing protein [Vicinamibacteria bacterium]